MYHSHIRIVHRGTPCFTGNKARSKGFLPHGGSSWIANTKWEHAPGMNGLLRAPYHSQKSNLPAHSLRESKVISKRIVNVSGVFFFFCPYILISLCHVICRHWMLMNLGSRTYGNFALTWTCSGHYWPATLSAMCRKPVSVQFNLYFYAGIMLHFVVACGNFMKDNLIRKKNASFAHNMHENNSAFQKRFCTLGFLYKTPKYLIMQDLS